MSSSGEILKKLVTERSGIYYADSEDPRVDKMAEEILEFINKNRDLLTVDESVEAITHLGGAPSILYDDNGHFAVAEEGHQNLPTFDDDFETKRTKMYGTWYLKAGAWKETIREALYFYLDRHNDEE